MTRIVAAMVFALVLAAQPVLAAEQCAHFNILATTATPVPLTPYVLSPFNGPVTAWLKINAAGGGTPAVAVNLYGPGNASALLCNLSASTTMCGVSGPIYAVTFSPTGCTTSCDLTVSICGTNQGPLP